MMIGEIRGLLAKTYSADDGDCNLEIFKDDEGTHIWLMDYAFDLVYQFLIDENGEVVSFHIDHMLEEEEF